MRVLVTGGAGFIGSHVVDRCISAGHDVVVVDNLSTGNRQVVPPAARLAVIDIRSPGLADVFRAEQPDAVIHLAAQAEVRRSVEKPLLDADVNIMGSVNLLECSRRFGVTRWSTRRAAAPSTATRTCFRRRRITPPDPASPYGVSKLTVEHYLGCWAGLYGIRRVALRYANVYGPRQSPLGEAGVVAIFAHRLLSGEPSSSTATACRRATMCTSATSQRPTSSPSSIRDASGPVNIGTGVETSVVELFEQLSRQRPAYRGDRSMARPSSANSAGASSSPRAPSTYSAGSPTCRSPRGCVEPSPISRTRRAQACTGFERRLTAYGAPPKPVTHPSARSPGCPSSRSKASRRAFTRRRSSPPPRPSSGTSPSRRTPPSGTTP